MLVDCHTCPVRDVHCADCMVTALAAIPMRAPEVDESLPLERAEGLPLDRSERRAVSILIAAGLVTHDEANRARAMTQHDREQDQVGRVSRAAV